MMTHLRQSSILEANLIKSDPAFKSPDNIEPDLVSLIGNRYTYFLSEYSAFCIRFVGIGDRLSEEACLIYELLIKKIRGSKELSLKIRELRFGDGINPPVVFPVWSQREDDLLDDVRQ